MTNSSLSTNEDRRARERRVWRAGIVASLVFHLLVAFLWRGESIPISPFAAAGPRAGDARAAAGGSMEAVELRARPPEPIVPPQVPVPVILPPEPVDFMEEPEVDHSLAAEAPGTAEAEGPEREAGIEGGEGRGDGGTAEEGLFRVTPPTPRGMIMPPSNRSLRGREVEVWVFVGADGRVVSDSTRLRPPTPDRDFNRRLIREAAQWIFEPARRGGVAVAAWFPYTISM